LTSRLHLTRNPISAARVKSLNVTVLALGYARHQHDAFYDRAKALAEEESVPSSVINRNVTGMWDRLGVPGRERFWHLTGRSLITECSSILL